MNNKNLNQLGSWACGLQTGDLRDLVTDFLFSTFLFSLLAFLSQISFFVWLSERSNKLTTFLALEHHLKFTSFLGEALIG